LAKHNTASQLLISKADADARQLANGEAIKIYNERGDGLPRVRWLPPAWRGVACGLNPGKLRAGTPIAVEPAGTSSRTSEFEAMVAQSPTFTAPMMLT
jgi:anaerobic selenocysteine-containing dehydrogenase